MNIHRAKQIMFANNEMNYPNLCFFLYKTIKNAVVFYFIILNKNLGLYKLSTV